MVLIDQRTYVAGQIRPEDMAGIAALGVAMVVNNRPDGEEPGQPAGAEIAAAAKAAGLGYRFLPVAGGVAPGQAEEMAAILDEADGKVLAFRRSGTRSTFLWALARALRGAERETLIAQAGAVGYDLTPLRTYLG